MRSIGSKFLLGLICISLVFFVNESISANAVFYGDSVFYFNNGYSNLSFTDSGVTLDYLEVDTGHNYVQLNDIMISVDTTNLVEVNVSQVDSSNGTGLTVGTTVLRFNASCIGGDVAIGYYGNITRGMYDVYVNGALEHEDIGRTNFKIGFSSWSDKDIDIKFAGIGAPMPFAEVNWTNISGNWSNFILSGYWSIFGVWTYPLIFLGIIGYVYCINRSAMSAAALICIMFVVFGATNAFASPAAAQFSLISWIIVVVSLAGLFTLIFLRRDRP